MDAAHVFKETHRGTTHPQWLPTLKMDTENLRVSYSLSKLSEASLAGVLSGSVSPYAAALVADNVADQKRQEHLIRSVSTPVAHYDVNIFVNGTPVPSEPSFTVTRTQVPAFTPDISAPAPLSQLERLLARRQQAAQASMTR